MARSNQNKRGGGAGGTHWSTVIDAGNYLINTMSGKTPTPEQQEAWDSLNNLEKKIVREEAKKELSLQEIDVPVRPEPKPVRSIPPLPTRRPERASTPPLPERRPSRPSTVDTQSTSLGRRIAESLMEAIGDTRTMEQASGDARVTKEMEMEREMNVAGRKKGGMVKKKKAPVKKAYGGMVKKKQGGSSRKVNMKAGFTRRGCSKG